MCRYFLTRVFTLFTFLCTSAISQTPVGKSVAGRFIVTYRNGAIPGLAERNAAAAGAHLVCRNEMLGIAIVQAPEAEASAIRARLAADLNVASIVEDRAVAAHAI